jgi:hypothetical protein
MTTARAKFEQKLDDTLARALSHAESVLRSTVRPKTKSRRSCRAFPRAAKPTTPISNFRHLSLPAFGHASHPFRRIGHGPRPALGGLTGHYVKV